MEVIGMADSAASETALLILIAQFHLTWIKPFIP